MIVKLSSSHLHPAPATHTLVSNGYQGWVAVQCTALDCNLLHIAIFRNASFSDTAYLLHTAVCVYHCTAYCMFDSLNPLHCTAYCAIFSSTQFTSLPTAPFYKPPTALHFLLQQYIIQCTAYCMVSSLTSLQLH